MLPHVCPNSTAEYSRNGRLTDAKMFGNLLMLPTIHAVQFDRPNLHLTKARESSSFFTHVFHVDRLCSTEKMLGIHTPSIVTSMQSVVVTQRAIVKLIGKTMGSHHAVITNIELPVSLFLQTCRPRPSFIR